jgi:hypothetical protein
MPREDKVLGPDEAQAFLALPVVVEEKVDGANLGLSLDPSGVLRVQNRGAYLEKPWMGQFKHLGPWVSCRQESLSETLGQNLILFGEWCAARHSLDYDHLPGWFLGFDVFDRIEQRFWSTGRRNSLLTRLGLPFVHQVCSGTFSLNDLQSMVRKAESRYRDGGLEGMVLRREDEEWLVDRCKLVHPSFTQAIGEHWSRRSLHWNQTVDPTPTPFS